MLRARDMLASALALAAVLSAALAAPPPPPPPAVPPPRPDVEAFRALSAVAAGEPGIADIQQAAAREAERDGSGLEAFPLRSRLAALVPRVTAEYRQDQQSYRVVGLQGSGEVDYLRVAPGSGFTVRATWDLGELVAARGELAAASAAAQRVRRREAAVSRATALFFERRRAMLALLLDPPAVALARAEAELDLDRLTAELDAITGGLFGRGTRP